jgi:CSLREA domain-containing protein
MKISIVSAIIMLFVLPVLVPSAIRAQLSFTVNSLADDEFAYPYDDPETEEDESMDGICEDEQGRCTLRAAIEEANNMDLPVDLAFSVSGTINLTDALYPHDGSVLNGGKMVELSGINCFVVDQDVEIAGFQFNTALTAITVTGNHNQIGGVLNGNVFTNCYIGVIIEGDSNEVISNSFGLDMQGTLVPNQVGIMIIGNYNRIGRSVATYSNTFCGSSIAGITVNEGEHNQIMNNFIGTTAAGDAGMGNTQGIVIGGARSNIIGGDNPTDRNVISGNTVQGISVTGVPSENYSDGTVIKNNIVGLAPDQSSAIPNDKGIVFTNGVWYADIVDNVIAGNSTDGILIFGYDDDSWTHGHTIENNRIGLNSDGTIIPNGNNGIHIWGNVEQVNIGTDEFGDYLPNIIAGNKGAGIALQTELNYSPQTIVFRKNRIYRNETANVSLSAQSNEGIDPPYSLSFNNNIVAGIHDIPGAIIDIYRADINEFLPSAHQWLASTTVGGNTVFAYEITDPTVEAVSATATDEYGNTSAFAYLELITGLEKRDEMVPAEFSLQQNYPNPFNPITNIQFSIPKPEFVTLGVYNELGQNVVTLLRGNYPAGNYTVTFDAVNLASGVYYYTLKAGREFIQKKKMVLVK